MENKCLVTRLLSSADDANNALTKVGNFKVKLSGNPQFTSIATTAYPVTTQLSISDAYPNVVFNENNQRTIVVDHLGRFRTASDDCEVIIEDKYKIRELKNGGDTDTECNIDELHWSPIEKLSLYSGLDGSNGKIKGHLSNLPPTLLSFSLYSKNIIVDELPDLPLLQACNFVLSETIDLNTIFAKWPSLTEMYGFYSNYKGTIDTLPTNTNMTLMRLERRGSSPHEVTGNIASLGSWTSLTTLNISGTKITGSITDFLDAMYNSGAGRTSGGITITVNSLVTNVSGSGTTQTYNFSASGWAKA